MPTLAVGYTIGGLVVVLAAFVLSPVLTPTLIRRPMVATAIVPDSSTLGHPGGAPAVKVAPPLADLGNMDSMTAQPGIQKLVSASAIPASCPVYTKYAEVPHGPLTNGPLKLPFQRPPPQCRTFQSPLVDKVIEEMTKRMVDPDLARLFENCFPNTLDTTVRWHIDSETHPRTFIVTGDINAEWIRDSHHQLGPYVRFAAHDPKLRTLLRGAIATHVEFMSQFPYCNAFNPPRGSGIGPANNDFNDRVYPNYDPTVVFEGKYELDSVASFFGLTNDYYGATNDGSVLNRSWLAVAHSLHNLIVNQMKPTVDPETKTLNPTYYSFQRETSIGTETLALNGNGHPVNGGTSLVRSAFRPSDDATILQFFIPANAQISVELNRTAQMLQAEGVAPELAKRFAKLSAEIRAGIENFGKIDRRNNGQPVYAFEVDGFGGQIFMDDANLPSLLSLPDMGFCAKDDPTYLNTRELVLSPSNPYYAEGKYFNGVGGPHAGIRNAWPLSHMLRIRTTNNDDEIRHELEVLKHSTHGLGLMHESINVDKDPARTKEYTRPWFAWANSEFAKTILDVATRKPELIFKHGETADFLDVISI